MGNRREAKYLADLEVYTGRQIDIIYGNPILRASNPELSNLVRRADSLKDYETLQVIIDKYNYDILEDILGGRNI